MAQPKLELLSLEVSKKAGDQVTVATADGKDFTSQQRLRAIHDARKSLFFTVFNQMKLKDFTMIYPEFTKEITNQSINTGNNFIFSVPDDFRVDIAMKVTKDDTAYTESKRFVAEAEYESTLDPYSVFKASVNCVRHVVRDNKIKVFGLTGTYFADLLYLT